MSRPFKASVDAGAPSAARTGATVGFWRRVLRRPQRLWIRRALFQVHLWTGLAVGTYVLAVSVTGSLLVYRNELYRAATPAPLLVAPSGPRLTPDELKAAAARAHPGFVVDRVFVVKNPNQAIAISLKRGKTSRERLFNPYTGEDLGNSIAWGIRVLSWLLDLHDNLLFGTTGRLVNGVGALLLVILAFTGSVVWWPGIQSWRRSLMLHRKVGWKRFTWDLHSAIGFWSLAFVLLFAITGVYLSYPDPFQAAADFIEPSTDENLGSRTVDRVTYWLAYLHFGRFGGRSTKAAWAVFGLAPAGLFITGVLMWWNRVVRQRAGEEVQREALRT